MGIWFPDILWYFNRPLLATPESRADSFSFMCAHLFSPSVMAVNPIRELHWPVKRNAIGWLAEVTFAVQRRRLSCLQILTCRGRGRKKKSLFSQPRYEKVTFAGVVWRPERMERER